MTKPQTGLPAIVEKMAPEIQKSLGAQLPAERFIRALKTTLSSNPNIENLDRHSVLKAVMRAAEDGLPIDGVHAAIVPKGKQAVYIPMVAGVIKKMRQHTGFAELSHGIIYLNEVEQGRFIYTKGDSEHLEHNPIMFDDRGEPIGAYAVMTTKDGEKFRAVLTKEQIEKRLAVGANSGAKREWKEEFWIKTVIHALAKIAPNSSDEMGYMDGVFQSDTPAHETPHDADGVVTPDPVDDTPEPKQTKAAAAVMGQVDDIEDAEIMPDVAPYDDENIPL